MSKKGFIGILIFWMLTGLTGCSLAKEEVKSEKSQDRLIGALITQEYLDLFDLDAYLDDHAEKLVENKDLMVEDSDQYEDRIYAKIDKHDSQDPSEWEVSFPGIEGIRFFSPLWSDQNGESYHTTEYDEEICDAESNYNIENDHENLELSGSVYFLTDKEKDGISYYVNPVYQTEDGKIYVISGQGSTTSGASEEGETTTLTLTDQVTLTENQKSKIEGVTVKVTGILVKKPTKITLYQMNQDHQVITSNSYTPGKLPEKLTAEKDTAYFLIETQQMDQDGRTSIQRELYEQKEDQDALETLVPLKNGLVSKQYTEVLWEE